MPGLHGEGEAMGVELTEGAACLLTDMVRQGWVVFVPYGQERWARRYRVHPSRDGLISGGDATLGDVIALLHAGMLTRGRLLSELPNGDVWRPSAAGIAWVDAQPKGDADVS